MKTTQEDRIMGYDGIQWTLWNQVDDLYVDVAQDLALLSHNQQQMQEKKSHLGNNSAKGGLSNFTKRKRF